MKVLAIDVGGTHVKILASGHKKKIEFLSGPRMTSKKMVAEVKTRVKEARWEYEVISMGYPGPVHHDRPVAEPWNLGKGWVAMDFKKAFGCPVKIMNDAAMQAAGSYEGGRMLFLGLGTGLGSALIVDSVIEPLELAHLPYRKEKTFEDYVGLRGLARLGKQKWRHHVEIVVNKLMAAMQTEYVILGGGNARLLKKLPPNARLGDNANAFRGAFRVWNPPSKESKPRGRLC